MKKFFTTHKKKNVKACSHSTVFLVKKNNEVKKFYYKSHALKLFKIIKYKLLK